MSGDRAARQHRLPDLQPPAGAHVTRGRHMVTLGDVDAVQINFQRYYDWASRAYEQLFRELGHPLEGLLAAGFAQPVAGCDSDFFSPVTLGAEVEQTTWVQSVGSSSFELYDRFESGGGLLAVVSTTHVWIRLEPKQRPEPLPPWLRAAGQGIRVT